MRLKDLDELLREASSLRELARCLNLVCAEEEPTLQGLRDDFDAASAIFDLAAAVAHVPFGWWVAVERRGGFATIRSEGAALDELLLGAAAYGVAAHYGLLLGLCQGPLRVFFDLTRERLRLLDGDLVPLPRRPTHTVFATTTVSPETGMFKHLLERTGFTGHQRMRGPSLDVVLDFRQRERLDRVTWIGAERSGRLPTAATIHPYRSGDELELAEPPHGMPSKFFGLRPKRQPTERIDATLRALTGVEAVMLPELSLADPDILERRVAAEPESYPPLIVLGSAHVERRRAGAHRPVRANEARVLLDGRRLLTYDKIHPFRFKPASGGDAIALREPAPPHVDAAYSAEDLTPVSQLVIASGTYTRLAVAICADLNDSAIPALLAGLMVNLCLVPSLTETRGNFVPALQTLAGGVGQCVSLICNGTMPAPGSAASTSPLVWVGVPTGGPDAVTEHGPPAAGRATVGLVRFTPTGAAVEWTGPAPAGDDA